MSLEQSVTALEQRNAELVSEVVRARDAVMGLSNMYTTITLGLAGTEDGQYFTVPGNGAYQKLYQHDGAQAPLIATYPSNSDLTDALTTLNTAMSDHVALPDPHAQYAEIAGGAAANFTVMPQVGGDPIVESGGNSDGEWTRWADGLLINRVKIIAVVATANTQASVTWTYPAPLIAITHSVPHGFIVNQSSTVAYTMLQPLFANSVGTSSTLFYMKADTTQEYRYALQIIGRWK